MSYDDLLGFILPNALFDYFELVDFKPSDEKVYVHFNEQNILPEEYSTDKLETKVPMKRYA